METQDPPVPAPGMRGVLELSYEVRRGQEAIRRAIAKRRIRSIKVANNHLFDPPLWAAAVAYYRELDARREGKVGDEREE